MRKTAVLALFVVFVSLLFLGCTKQVSDLSIDDSNPFLTIVKWTTYGRGEIIQYEFREGLGTGTLKTTRFKLPDMQTSSKTVDAKMGDIERGNGFVSFKMNGVKYIYKP